MRRRGILGFVARHVAAWWFPDSSTANQARAAVMRSQAGKLRVSSMKNRRCILESCYRLRHTLKMQTAGSFIQKCHPSVSLPGNRGLSAPAPPLPEAVSSQPPAHHMNTNDRLLNDILAKIRHLSLNPGFTPMKRIEMMAEIARAATANSQSVRMEAQRNTCGHCFPY